VSLRIAVDGRYIQDRFPGIGRYTYNLIHALASRATGDEFLVLHDPSLENTRYDVTKLEALPGIVLQPVSAPLPPAWPGRPSCPLSRLAPGLFHAPHYLKPYRTPCPSVTTVHDLIPLRCPPALPSRARRLLFRLAVWLACRTSTVILTLSEASRHDLEEVFQLPPGKVHVTPAAAEESFRPQPEEEVERVRRRYGLPARYILYLGSHKPHKNLSRLVEAWAQVRADVDPHNRGPEIKLVLAGREDPRYPQTRRRARVTGANESVLFPGDIAERDLPALHSGATLFVYPSLYEGFGLPVLEAMACGAPVVCSNAGALPEVAGDAALSVAPQDVRALAQAIGRTLTDEGLRRRLATQSRAQAARFSWDRTARRTLAVYHAVGRPAQADGKRPRAVP
jgi:glycosyltransferase involved in cell wall biosynthesis